MPVGYGGKKMKENNTIKIITWITGILTVLLGIYAVVRPMRTFLSIGWILGILAIICGVLSVIVSIIAFTHPILTMFSVGYMIAFSVLMQGINMIVLAMNLGKTNEE